MIRILTAILLVLAAACAPVPPVDNQPDTKVPLQPTENGVIRVLSTEAAAEGDTVEVKLYINLLPGQGYYLVDEGVPQGIEVIDQEPNKDNRIRLAQIQDAKSAVFTYHVRAPAPGTYSFEGEYAFEGMDSEQPIKGDASLVVR